MNTRDTRRETGRALEAFQEYLALPQPRDYKVLVGKTPRSKSGRVGKPYALHTLREWAYMFKWQDRARQHDEDVARESAANLLRFKVEQQERRLRQRLQAAEVQRSQALQYLVDEATHRPRLLQHLEPRLAEIAGMYIKQAGDAERLDLADVTEREAQQPMTVHVLTPEGLAELQNVVAQVRIETPAARMIDDIIDAEVEVPPDNGTRVTADADVGRSAEPSFTHAS